MIRRLAGFVLVAAALSLAAAQEPPGPPPAAEDPAAAVIDEVQAFYAAYRQAWDDRNTLAIANSLAGDFVAYQHVEGKGVVELDKVTAVGGIQQFFDAVRGRDTRWGRTVLTIVPRSPTEAVAALRNDFALRGGGGEVELTLEVLRKGPDGRWRLARKWTEKTRY